MSLCSEPSSLRSFYAGKLKDPLVHYICRFVKVKIEII